MALKYVQCKCFARGILMTTATINVTLRLDKNLKEQADEFFNNLGLSLNSGINMFIKQSLRERQLPFLPSLNTPNAETRAALDEARACYILKRLACGSAVYKAEILVCM